MSALGQKQTFALQKVMSALPPKADMCRALGNVRFVPIADIQEFGSHKRKTPGQCPGILDIFDSTCETGHSSRFDINLLRGLLRLGFLGQCHGEHAFLENSFDLVRINIIRHPEATDVCVKLNWDCATSKPRFARVRFGSEADIPTSPRDVRFTPESRHSRRRLDCPFCANSGLISGPQGAAPSFDLSQCLLAAAF